MISLPAQTNVILSRFIVICLALLLVGCAQTSQEPQPSLTPVTQVLLTTTYTAPLNPSSTSTPDQDPTDTPPPTASLTPSPTFSPSSVQDWGKGRIFFDVTEHSFGDKDYLGIFSLNLEAGTLIEVWEEGGQLLDVSPDYQRLLVSQDQNLYTVYTDGREVKLLADNLLSSSAQGARWVESSEEIVYIASEDDKTKLIRVNDDGKNPVILLEGNPVIIYSATSDRLVWGEGICNSFGGCTQSSVVWSDGQGNEIAAQQMEERQLLPCQTVSHFVYVEKDENDIYSLHIQPHQDQDEIIFWLAGTEYSDCAWSPDQKQVSVVTIDRGWYSGTVHLYRQLILDVKSREITLLPVRLGMVGNSYWSPDGDYLLYTGTENTDDHYQAVMRIINIKSLSINFLDENIDQKSSNYITVNHVFWLP